MNREEMLKRLHTISIGVELTALISENALECEYVMPTGTHYEWIGLYDWPVYALNLPKNFNLDSVKTALANGTFNDSQIAGTDIEKLYSEYLSTGHEETSPAVFLSQLINVSSLAESVLYALISEDKVLFFGSYKLLAAALENQHVGGATPWESYSDDELAAWIDRLETEFKDIPLSSFEE
jgi:hypothetical protein